MLAQSFQSAADLGISEEQKDALIKTLKLMETGKLRHVSCQELALSHQDGRPRFDGLFNMSWSSHTSPECGTVCCIKGTAELIAGVHFVTYENPPGLDQLFYGWIGDPPPEKAARALRSYLNTGDPKWAEAVA